MPKSPFAFVLVAAAASALAGCSVASDGDGKAVADLRADLQRMQNESDRQKEQISLLQRRVDGLAEDLPRVRRASLDTTAVAPAPGDGPSAGADPAAPAADGAPTEVKIAEAPAIKAFLESEDGRNSVASALKAVQDRQEQERTQRMVDGMLARLAKEAELTEDQTKKMKDILGRSSVQIRDLFQTMRDGGDAPDARQTAMAKMTEIRQAADLEVKAVLSQTQYEVYQKQIPQGMGQGGFGGGRPGRPGGN